MCRLCHREVERISHLADCRCLRPIWDKFNTLHTIKPTSTTDRHKLLLLGVSVPELPQAISDLHLIIWKFIIIHFTLVDIDKRPFKTDDVWTGATRRYLSKVNSLQQKVRLEVKDAEARDRPARIRRFNRLLAPLATINADGKIKWSSVMAPYAAALSPAGEDHSGP